MAHHLPSSSPGSLTKSSSPFSETKSTYEVYDGQLHAHGSQACISAPCHSCLLTCSYFCIATFADVVLCFPSLFLLRLLFDSKVWAFVFHLPSFGSAKSVHVVLPTAFCCWDSGLGSRLIWLHACSLISRSTRLGFFFKNMRHLHEVLQHPSITTFCLGLWS